MSTNWLQGLAFGVMAAALSWYLSGLPDAELFEWDKINIWFDSDIPRIVKNLTVREEGHGGTFKHPLFPLLAWPPTALLTALVGDEIVAVRLMLAANAATGALLLMALLKRLDVRPVDQWTAAGLYMASAAFMFWFGVAETFPFGATTILVGLWGAVLATEPQSRRNTILLIAIGTLSFSITITNICAFMAALGVGLWVYHGRSDLGAALRRWAIIVMAVVAVTAVLAVIQDRIFGEAGLFFNIFALMGERQFIGQEAAMPIWSRPAVLVLGALVVGMWETVPAVNVLSGTQTEIVKLSMPSYALFPAWRGLLQAAGILGLLAVFLSGLLRAHARGRFETTPERTAILWASMLTVVGFSVLHAIYGAEVFLYVAHMLPPLCLVFALALSAANSVATRLLAVAALLLIGTHNMLAISEAHVDSSELNSPARSG